MRQTRRTIYRGGYIQFENLNYWGETLAEHAGEPITLRYDPRDIARVLVYRHEPDREVYLGVAQAQDFEGEMLALDDAKAYSRRIREDGRAVSNDSMLDEMRDREAFIDQKKKTRKDRQKEEQSELRLTPSPPIPLDIDECPSVPGSKTKTDKNNSGLETSPTDTDSFGLETSPAELVIPHYEVWDFNDEDDW